MVVELKKEGKCGTEHHPPLESGDLLKLYTYVNDNRYDASMLQAKVFVDIMLHSGRRGLENLRDLKVSDFWMTTDSDHQSKKISNDKQRFIYMKRDELTKNH